MKRLTPQQMRFVIEYVRTGSGTDAAIAAGYSPRGAASRASKLLSLPSVQEYRREVARDMFQQIGVDDSWIGYKLVNVVERCMEAQPHMVRDPETKQYVPDGNWTFNATGAIKALHELANLVGIVPEREQDEERPQSFEDWLEQHTTAGDVPRL